MTAKRHLRLVPDPAPQRPSPLLEQLTDAGFDVETSEAAIEAAITEAVELAAAGCIDRGEHLWHPERDTIIPADRATPEDRQEYAAARLRHAQRVDRGEPVSAAAAQVDDAIRRYRVQAAAHPGSHHLPPPDQL